LWQAAATATPTPATKAKSNSAIRTFCRKRNPVVEARALNKPILVPARRPIRIRITNPSTNPETANGSLICPSEGESKIAWGIAANQYPRAGLYM
jgi:hypothetical protein